MSPDSPAWHGIAAGAPADLVSPRGRLRVRPAVMPGLHPEAVVYRRGDWISMGGGVNQLGFKGTEKLGNGLTAYFKYNTEFSTFDRGGAGNGWNGRAGSTGGRGGRWPTTFWAA